nr:MAG TPA: hypothetical protein [Caudoviricetes sp.]
MFFVLQGGQIREDYPARPKLTLTPAIASGRTLYGWPHPRRL